VATTAVANAFLIGCAGGEPVAGAAVVVEGERIKDVIRSGKVGPLKGWSSPTMRRSRVPSSGH
jgi:hypothetical protein